MKTFSEPLNQNKHKMHQKYRDFDSGHSGLFGLIPFFFVDNGFFLFAGKEWDSVILISGTYYVSVIWSHIISMFIMTFLLLILRHTLQLSIKKKKHKIGFIRLTFLLILRMPYPKSTNVTLLLLVTNLRCLFVHLWHLNPSW